MQRRRAEMKESPSKGYRRDKERKSRRETSGEGEKEEIRMRKGN